jgi:hypothetical protein
MLLGAFRILSSRNHDGTSFLVVLWINDFILEINFLGLFVLGNEHSEFQKVFITNFTIFEVFGFEFLEDENGLIFKLLIFEIWGLLKIKCIKFILFKDSKPNPFKVLNLSDNISEIKHIVNFAFNFFPLLTKLPFRLAT